MTKPSKLVLHQKQIISGIFWICYIARTYMDKME